MHCDSIIYSGHALVRMFERKISQSDVRNIIQNSEIVADYFDDQPYPSKLLLGFIAKRPLHIVVAYNKENHACIVVTAYVPSLILWSADFKTRKE